MRAEPPLIATALDAHDVAAPHMTGPRERVVALLLAADRRLVDTLLFEGMAAAVDLPLRTIVARALSLDARAIVLAHNHPSGDAEPSAADRAATRRLAAVCGPLGIGLADHIVFGDGTCVSMRARGLI